MISNSRTSAEAWARRLAAIVGVFSFTIFPGRAANAGPFRPDVGNWAWSVQINTKTTALDSVQAGNSKANEEIVRLREKFENKLRKELGKRCTFSTYGNLPVKGSIDIVLTLTRAAFVQGSNGQHVRTGPNTGAVGPDGFPIRSRPPAVTDGREGVYKDAHLKLKSGKVGIAEVRVRVLDSDGVVHDSLLVKPNGPVKTGELAQNLVSAMALVVPKVK